MFIYKALNFYFKKLPQLTFFNHTFHSGKKKQPLPEFSFGPQVQSSITVNNQTIIDLQPKPSTTADNKTIIAVKQRHKKR